MKFPRLDRLIWAGLRALWWKILRRPVLVPADVHDERISECENDCEWFDPVDRQCLDCTCFVDAKTWIACESCPRKKWDIYLAKHSKGRHKKQKI